MFRPLKEVAALLQNFQPEWFVAGGWAIDLFLGEETRYHSDVEIAVFRQDQIALRNYLDGWILKKAVSGKLIEWQHGEILKLPVHEIHCFNSESKPDRLEVLLNELDGDEWRFRRNPRICKPRSEIFLTSNRGVKFLRPEIVLLYKSKNPRPKDEQDFDNVLENLGADSTNWLRNALVNCYPNHLWLSRLNRM